MIRKFIVVWLVIGLFATTEILAGSLPSPPPTDIKYYPDTTIKSLKNEMYSCNKGYNKRNDPNGFGKATCNLIIYNNFFRACSVDPTQAGCTWFSTQAGGGTLHGVNNNLGSQGQYGRRQVVTTSSSGSSQNQEQFLSPTPSKYVVPKNKRVGTWF